MLRKFTVMAAVLTMLLIASVPVLAQQGSGDLGDVVHVPYTVSCTQLYQDLTALCPVDENGFITLPDGSKAPASITGNPVRDENGNTVEFVDGRPVIVGFAQYDNTSGPSVAQDITLPR